MKQGPTWFSRAGLRSGPPALRLAQEIDEIRLLRGYPFWEKLQLWIERNTPLCPALIQIRRRWSMRIQPMMGREIEVIRDEDDHIRFVEIGFNHHQTVFKVELDTARGRHIFVAELMSVAQVPLNINAARRSRRSNARGNSRAAPR